MVSQSLTDKEKNVSSNWQDFFRPHGALADRFTQKLPRFLQTLDDLPTAVDTLLQSKLLVSPRKFLLQKNDDDNTTVGQQLRCIQVQASVRVGLWAFAGPTFTEPFARIIRERKKKTSKRRALACCSQKDSTSIIFDELISVLQLAAFLLGPETSFASFLAQCINRPCYEAIPILRRLFQHFECPNPYVEEAPLPLRPLQRRRHPPLPAPQRQVEKQQSKKKEGSLKENTRPFTAPAVRRNSLLQGKTRYVGSHFNNHSVASLFRSGALPTTSTSKPVVTPRDKPSKQRGTKRRVLVPATPCCPKKTKPKASPAVGSLVAQAFQSIDQGNRRRRRK